MVKKRIVVGASYGARDWLIQRLSAVVMMVYMIMMVSVFVVYPPTDYDRWHTVMAYGPVMACTGLFFLAILYHAWIGMRDIWMDYVKTPGLRLALHVLTCVALIVYAGWVFYILWRL